MLGEPILLEGVRQETERKEALTHQMLLPKEANAGSLKQKDLWTNEFIYSALIY